MLIFQTVRNATHTQSPQNLTSLMSIGKNTKKVKILEKQFLGGHLLAKYGKNRLKFNFSWIFEIFSNQYLFQAIITHKRHLKLQNL